MKYEVQLLKAKPKNANKKLVRLQKEGWVIAGNIEYLKDESVMVIPLKKEIKERYAMKITLADGQVLEAMN